MHGQQLHACAHDHKCVGIKLAISTVKIKDVVSDPRGQFCTFDGSKNSSETFYYIRNNLSKNNTMFLSIIVSAVGVRIRQ